MSASPRLARPADKTRPWFWLLLLAALAGCMGRPVPAERAARQQVAAVARQYRPGDLRPPLPVLSSNAPWRDFVLFAVLNHPQVEAAYYEWAAATEQITTARSLPDPRLTFQSDVAGVLMALMPGVMMDFPGPGKIRSRAAVAAAEGEARYHAFETAVLQAAFAVHQAWYEYHFAQQRLALLRELLDKAGDLQTWVETQQPLGKATLQDALQAQIERQRLQLEVQNAEDSLTPLAARFKGALGLKPTDPNPPWPARFEPWAEDRSPDQLLEEALAHNPGLRAIAAEIRLAEAAVAMARKEKVPDFSLGLEVNAYASPIMASPQAGVTLPIWKDKIAAEIAAASARRRAAGARLTAAQIQLAVEVAQRLFTVREATRQAEWQARHLIPQAQLALEISHENFRSGKADYLNVIQAQRNLLEFRLAEVSSRAQRELALAELHLLLAGRLPAGAPVRPGSATTAHQPQ